MIAILIACLAVSGSVVVVAFVWGRIRGVTIAESMPRGLQTLARMAEGPFAISLGIHLAIILALVIAVHDIRARELMLPVWIAGGNHAFETVEPIQLPDVEIHDFAHKSAEDSPTVIDPDKVMRAYSKELAGTTNPDGLSLGWRFGDRLNTHPGVGGSGGLSFPWYIIDLRRKGLDVVLVIDGTKSTEFVMADVKARMTQLVFRVRQLVPIARVGVVVFGGKGEPLQMQPLTLSTAKLQTFLNSIQANGGGEWEENTLGAVQAAVTKMDWKPYARKVIVLIGDSPPEKDDFAPLVALLHDFRSRNGTLSAVDVQQEEHERFARAFWIKVHHTEPTEKDIGPLPPFAEQAQAASKMLAAQGGGSVRSLSHDADVNHQVMILIFGDKWQDEVSRFASR